MRKIKTVTRSNGTAVIFIVERNLELVCLLLYLLVIIQNW